MTADLIGKVQRVRRERGEEAADRIYDVICNRYGVECMLADSAAMHHPAPKPAETASEEALQQLMKETFRRDLIRNSICVSI
jgi:hypothetical protein